jgi:hypothetical protein
MRRGDGLLKRQPSGCPEALETGQLRLDRDAEAPRGGDQRSRPLRDRGSGALADPDVCFVTPRRQARRVGVQSKTDLASALRDEGGESVREESAQTD